MARRAAASSLTRLLRSSALSSIGRSGSKEFGNRSFCVPTEIPTPPTYRLLLKGVCHLEDCGSVNCYYGLSTRDLSVSYELVPLVAGMCLKQHYIAISNGLLYLDDFDSGSVVWNPWYHHFKILPQSTLQLVSYKSRPYCMGFGFDPKAEEYKVVRFILNSDVICGQQVELYSAKSNLWKQIPTPDVFAIVDASIYFKGVYYWAARGKTKEKLILSFNFTSESFEVSRFPNIKIRESYDVDFVEFDGMIGIIAYQMTGSEKDFELWFNVGGSWVKESGFHLCNVHKPIGFWENRKLFIEGLDQELLLYDASTGTSQNTGIRTEQVDTMKVIRYVKSNLRLDCV